MEDCFDRFGGRNCSSETGDGLSGLGIEQVLARDLFLPRQLLTD
jgi:hypothetical protein